MCLTRFGFLHRKNQSDEVLAGVPAEVDSALVGSALAASPTAGASADASVLAVSGLSAPLGAGLLVGELDRESVTYQPEPLKTMPVA
jgi:hypothetical protein